MSLPATLRKSVFVAVRVAVNIKGKREASEVIEAAYRLLKSEDAFSAQNVKFFICDSIDRVAKSRVAKLAEDDDEPEQFSLSYFEERSLTEIRFVNRTIHGKKVRQYKPLQEFDIDDGDWHDRKITGNALRNIRARKIWRSIWLEIKKLLVAHADWRYGDGFNYLRESGELERIRKRFESEGARKTGT